jgi:hypothetical protein
VIVVGGHSRKIGKSSVVATLISGFRECRWTALKITSHHHDAPSDEPFALTREIEATATDSGRYLAAGAERSFLLRASATQLEQAMCSLKPILHAATNVIIESNRIIDLLQPDLYLLVVDPTVDDWKASALRNLQSADAILLVRKERSTPSVPSLPSSVPWFAVEPPTYSSPELFNFVAQRLEAASGGD